MSLHALQKKTKKCFNINELNSYKNPLTAQLFTVGCVEKTVEYGKSAVKAYIGTATTL